MSPSGNQDRNYRASSPIRHRPSHQSNDAIIPALLMAPPTTFVGSLWLGWYRFTHQFGAPTPPAFRFVLFIFKMALLARACWPGGLNVVVGGGLLMAAAVDLTWTLEVWTTALLLVLHLVFVFVLRSRAQLCQAGPELWEWNSGLHPDGVGDA